MSGTASGAAPVNLDLGVRIGDLVMPNPVGVAMVYKASRAVSIPVIGLGGISDADDAIQYLLAGAVAVQVGTAIFSRPEAPLEILAGIRAYMESDGIERVDQLRGLIRP